MNKLESMVKEEMTRMKRSKNNGMALFMTDQHYPYHSGRNHSMTLDYVNNNKKLITHLIFGGDGIDNPALSSFPERADSKTLLQEELDGFTDYVNHYHQLVPKAKIIILKGNHDASRIDRTINESKSLSSLRSVQYASLLKESAADQGFKWVPEVRDTYKLWDNYFTHGDPRIDPYLKGGATGVRRTAEMHPEQGNIIFGHKHQVITYPRVKGDYSVYSVGCLADISALNAQYKPYHGYQNGFLVVTRVDGKTQIDNLEIKPDRPLYVDGVAYD